MEGHESMGKVSFLREILMIRSFPYGQMMMMLRMMVRMMRRQRVMIVLDAISGSPLNTFHAFLFCSEDTINTLVRGAHFYIYLTFDSWFYII